MAQAKLEQTQAPSALGIILSIMRKILAYLDELIRGTYMKCRESKRTVVLGLMLNSQDNV